MPGSAPSIANGAPSPVAERPARLQGRRRTPVPPTKNTTNKHHNKHHQASSEVNHVTTSPPAALIKVAGFVGPHPAVILIDCGATGNFVSAAFAQARKLPLTVEGENTVRLPDGREQPAGKTLRSAAVRVGSYTDRMDLVVTALSGYDVILGMPWLEQ